MTSPLTVTIPADILRWILSIGDTARLNDKQQTDVKNWLNGTGQPTVPKVKELGKKLHVPFGYFFLPRPIDDTPAVFERRTVGSTNKQSTPSRDLIDTINEMLALQDWAHEDAKQTGLEPLPFVGSATLQTPALQFSANIRKQLNLSEEWYTEGDLARPAKAFKLLRERVESTGIIVMMNGIVGQNTHRPLNPEEFRAFALTDSRAPLIFINRNDQSEAGRVFSLLHESAHVWLGSEELYNDNGNSDHVSPTEQLCNQVASELLMPQSKFEAAWEKHDNLDSDERIKILSKEFPVSFISVALRAYKSKFISRTVFEKIQNDSVSLWRETPHTNSSGGDYYKTKLSRIDSRLLDRIATSIAEGRTTYTEAYRLTKTNRESFPKLLEKANHE